MPHFFLCERAIAGSSRSPALLGPVFIPALCVCALGSLPDFFVNLVLCPSFGLLLPEALHNARSSASDNSPHYFRFPLRAASGRSASFLVVFSVRCCMWIVAGTRLGVIFELSDKKARGFLVSIALNRLLPEHVCKMFGEMLVRT
jgi:hypothetical protein